MKIFILRHGQAEIFQTTDSLRALTAKGRQDTEEIVNHNIERLAGITSIYASPYLRAQQTAAIATEILSNSQLKTVDWLVPDFPPDQVLLQLNEIQEKNILLVSHLPLVGIVANQLCGYESNCLSFATSSLVGIECDIPAKAMSELLFEAHVN